MSSEVISRLVMKPMSRDRTTSIAVYSDGSALMNIDGAGIVISLHLSKEDVALITKGLSGGV